MSWFGGNLPQLSSITNQISSFTKEVLTETTEEVEDPTAELHIARRKIHELESLNKHVQAEWDKLKKHSEEVNERAETAEYQIATISQEYRKLLQEKDEELRRLKVDREKLREQQKGFVHSGGGSSKDGFSPQSPLKQLASSRFFGEELISAVSSSSQSNLQNGPGRFEGVDLEDGEFHDFGDVISSQSEINRLQSELARLKVECQHWKTAAHQKESSLKSESKESDVAQLKGRIQELEVSLQQEIVQHQRELSGLQTVQNERLNSLTQRHQHEVDQLQSKINQLERERANTDDSRSSTATLLNHDEKEGEKLKMRCAELEEEAKKLKRKISELENESLDGETKERLQQLSVENVRLNEVNRQLESQLKREQATMSGLQREITALKEQFSLKKDSQLADLEQEKQELTSKLSDKQASIAEQESILSRLQQEYSQSQHEVEQLTGKMERLGQELQAKEREIHSLQGVVKSGSRDKERAASDLAGVLKQLEEKNRLVGELKGGLNDLKEVLKERESELSSQKEIVRVASDKEDKLRQQYIELEQRHSQEVEQFKVQLAAAEKIQAVQLETSAAESQEGYSKLQEELTEINRIKQEMGQVLSEKENLLKQRGKDITDLSAKLDVSTGELQQARAELLRVSAEKEMLNQQRNALQAEVTGLSQVKGQLESKIRLLEESGGSLGEELQRKLEAKEQECAKYGKQLASLKAHLIEVEERYTQEAVLADQRMSGLKQEAANLHEQLKATSHQGALQSEQTQQELEAVQRELQVMMEERDDALLQMTNAQEQAKQNATALRNLQAVLEEFQRDQSSELSQALKRSQTELASALQESQQLKAEIEELRGQLVEANGAAEAAAILNQELEDKEKKVAELTREIENLHGSLAQKEHVLSQLSKIEMDRVDIDRKKPEVVQLIHKILDFSPEELEMALRGSGGGVGWFSGLWGRRQQQPTTPKTPPPDKGTSLSRLFVNFLETESTPVAKPHPPILPTPSTATPSGYIDPRTDPDRPSLATAPLLKPHPLHTTPSHTSSGGDGLKPIPDQKPSPIPTPKPATSQSTGSRQVAKGHDSRPLEQNIKQQNPSSTLFFFTLARPNSADSAGSTETNNQVSRSSQSSILRNVLS